MISLDYLVFYCAYLSVLLLVFVSVSDFCEKLKEKIWEYNKKEIIKEIAKLMWFNSLCKEQS